MNRPLAARLRDRPDLCLAAVLTVILWGAAATWAAGPEPGRKPLDDNGRMQIDADDRCPVCGMKVAASLPFSSAIQLLDGTTYYFCGTGCMLRSWLHPEIFLAVDKARLKIPLVQDYFTGEQLDGRRVYWIAGSDVVGPMGPALVPIKGEDALESFKRRHGGRTVFRLDELTDEKWTAITGRHAAR